MVKYDRELQRVWVFNQRMHHGATGIALVAVGVLLALHDRRDIRVWFKRELWNAVTPQT